MCFFPGRFSHRHFRFVVFMAFVWTHSALADDRPTKPGSALQAVNQNHSEATGNAQDSAAESSAALLQEGKECEKQGDQVKGQVLEADKSHRSTAELIGNEVQLYQCAIDDYSKAITKTPDNVEAYELRGMAFAKRDQDGHSSLLVASQVSNGGIPRVFGAIAEFGPEAIADLNHAVEIAPKDAEAYYVRGEIYKMQFLNKYNLYFSLTDPAEKAQVNPDTSLARSAVADFKKATAINPHMGKAYEELGKLYVVCLRFSDAAASLRKAAECGVSQNEKLLDRLDTVAKDPTKVGFTKAMLESCSLE